MDDTVDLQERIREVAFWHLRACGEPMANETVSMAVGTAARGIVGWAGCARPARRPGPAE